MKKHLTILLTILTVISYGNTNQVSINILELSKSILTNSIQDTEIESDLKAVKSLTIDDIQKQIKNDSDKILFWVNIYNAFTRIALKNDPEMYENNRRKFFKRKNIEIAGFVLSLEDIEHDILRRGATIWTKGYLRIPFRNKHTRKFRIKEIDPRIHFVLNCGAKSCPPVRILDQSNLDTQLDLACSSYLVKNCKLDVDENTLSIPAFISWFKGDFRGWNKPELFLESYLDIKMPQKIQLVTLPYDWTIDLENYIL